MGGIGYFYDEKLSSKFCYSHYKAFKKSNYFKIIASVEKNNNTRKYLRKKTNLEIYKSIKFVPKKYKIDIVVISTPTEKHLDEVKNSIKYLKPKLILCEKPLSNNITDAKKIVTLCKKNRIKLFTNYIRVSDPGVIKLKKIIKNLKIKKITSWYTKNFIHNGSHVINLLQFWFGKILKINKISKKNSVNTNHDYKIKFSNQDAYIFQGFANDFEYFSIEMIGTFGRIRYDYGGELITINYKKKDKILKNNFVLTKNNITLKNNFDKNQENVVLQLKNYLKGEKYFLCDGYDALKTNEIICSK